MKSDDLSVVKSETLLPAQGPEYNQLLQHVIQFSRA